MTRAFNPEQVEVLKLMGGIVESYRALSIGNAHGLKRLAKDYFNLDIDVEPTITAVRSRRGDRILAELKRLQDIIKSIEEKSR